MPNDPTPPPEGQSPAPSTSERAASQPGASPTAAPDTPGPRKPKVFLGALVALAVVTALYFVNHYWIAPVAVHEAQAMSTGGDHPLAPPFSLTDISGRKLDLADYKGKVVMLDFWATWCGPCRIEIPGFVQLQNRYRDQGFAIIGVSLDDGPEVVREFYQQFKMNYPVALGDDKLGELYGGILGMPTTFLIGRDGRIYAKHVGAMDVDVFEQEIKSLLAVQAGKEAEFKAAGATDEVELGSSATVNSEVPGVDISGLNATELAAFKKLLEGQPCTCGCKLNLLRCRREDRACGVSRKLAREALAKLSKTRV